MTDSTELPSSAQPQKGCTRTPLTRGRAQTRLDEKIIQQIGKIRREELNTEEGEHRYNTKHPDHQHTMRVIGELERLVVRVLVDPRLTAYAVTLTAKPNVLRHAHTEPAGRYLRTIKRNHSAYGVLGADVSEAEHHHHLHGVVVAPAEVEEDLVRAWCKLWPRDARPAREAQEVKPIKASSDIASVLAYALRPRVVHPPDWTLAKRVSASGPLHAVLVRQGIAPADSRPGAASPGAPRGSERPSAPSSTPDGSQSREKGCACGWCGQSLRNGIRSHARWCTDVCKGSARRALRAAEDRVHSRERTKLRERIADFELAGAPRREAITRAMESEGWTAPKFRGG